MFIDIEKYIGKKMWVNPKNLAGVTIRKGGTIAEYFVDLIFTAGFVASAKFNTMDDAQRFAEIFF